MPEPLLPVLPVDVPLVQRRLMEPIRHRSLLDQVLGDLCADLVRVLEGRALGARRLELALAEFSPPRAVATAPAVRAA